MVELSIGENIALSEGSFRIHECFRVKNGLISDSKVNFDEIIDQEEILIFYEIPKNLKEKKFHLNSYNRELASFTLQFPTNSEFAVVGKFYKYKDQIKFKHLFRILSKQDMEKEFNVRFHVILGNQSKDLKKMIPFFLEPSVTNLHLIANWESSKDGKSLASRVLNAKSISSVLNSNFDLKLYMFDSEMNQLGFVDPSNLRTSCNSLFHQGDNVENPLGGSETAYINFSSMPSEVKYIPVIVSSDSQNLNTLKTLKLSVMNHLTMEDLFEFDMSKDISEETKPSCLIGLFLKTAKCWVFLPTSDVSKEPNLELAKNWMKFFNYQKELF